MNMAKKYLRLICLLIIMNSVRIAGTASESGLLSADTPDSIPVADSLNIENYTEALLINPLFEYPIAPDTIPSLEGKSEFVVTHFWDKMNFKNKGTVDQNALNDAFQVWVSPMRWADINVVEKSVASLLKNIKKNPTLSLQMAIAAEESLHSRRAIFWNDRLYLRFIDQLLDQKKIPQARKERFIRHKTQIENTLVGEYPKPFHYTTPTGTKARYVPSAVITVIEFGDPDCDECRYSKLKMETDVTFSGLVDKGKVNILFIIPDPEDGWQTKLTGFSPKWHTGAAEDISDIYDIRHTPSFFVIGNDGKVIAKNINYKQAMAFAINAAQND